MLSRLALAIGLWAAILAPAAAETPLDEPALERRALELHKELRCLVCQNQSIAESNADLARDLRQLVRERIAAGDSDGEVRQYLVARYGDWVLLTPPVKRSTWLLWFGPVLLLAVGAGGLALWYRRRRRLLAPAPLSAEESRRLDDLLAGDS